MRHLSNKKHAHLKLTQAESASILIIPRLHLNELIEGRFEASYGSTIGSIFNIAVAIANLHRREDLALIFNEGQTIVAKLIASKTAPDGDDLEKLASYFDAADRYMCMQRKDVLLKTIRYVERRISNGEVTTVSEAARGLNHQTP